MKNIFKQSYVYMFSLLFIAALTSCNDDNELPKDYPDSGYLEFSSSATNVLENVTSVEIPVSMPYGINTNGLEVTYTAELANGTAPNAALGTFTFMIPAGEKTGNIAFDVTESTGNYDVLFTLVSVNHPDYQIGLSDGSKIVQHTLTVCNVEVLNTYNGAAVASIGVDGPAFNPTLTLVPGTTNQYTIDTAWGPDYVAGLTGNPGFNGMFVYSATITINDDYSVTVTGDDAWATGGTGTWDPCTNTITYTLTQGLFGNPFTTDVTLTP